MNESVDYSKLALQLVQQCTYPTYEDCAEHWFDIAKAAIILRRAFEQLRPRCEEDKP